MKTSYGFALSALFAGSVLAACGGGGLTGAANAPGLPSQSARKHLALAYTGTATLSAVRRTQALLGTAVTVTYNGKTVGSGELDSSGAATIAIQDDVPAGATVSVTAGSITASVVLAHTMDDTAVLVQVHTDGTITVSIAGGTQPQASPSPDDPNGASETEDDDGNPTDVDENNGSTALPANLPVKVSATCTTVTLTPLSSSIASARFEENIEDGDGGSEFKYEGPFTQAMTFPLVAQSARLRIRLFDAQNDQLLDLRAPLTAFGVSSCPAASPSPSPSASP